MTLIKSISGIRGTIGGPVSENLTPIDIVECTSGYASFLQATGNNKTKIVVGRDGRISGELVSGLVCQSLQMMGFDVVDLGLSTTPTVEIAVPIEEAAGGIIITASHNGKEWNALKFLNDKGEFISHEDGNQILAFIKEKNIEAAPVMELGKYIQNNDYIDIHIDQILALPYLSINNIRAKKFTVVVDCINSTGALILPKLLERLGATVITINDDVSGEFAHNPEPLPKHMTQLCAEVKSNNADLGICVDPDVDRLAFVDENGEAFGEEYTLVAVADFILSKEPGNTVSNLSSTRALSDVTSRYGKNYIASAVGEVNVVNAMKKNNAVIGGEGNGGVILPELHYGRDAVAGVALMLALLAERDLRLSELKSSYPEYHIIKQKIQLTPSIDIEKILATAKTAFTQEKLNDIDGLKVDFENGWVHLRKSNTEPIIRVYAEAASEEIAHKNIELVKSSFNHLI
jgi:phosphomannomutase